MGWSYSALYTKGLRTITNVSRRQRKQRTLSYTIQNRYGRGHFCFPWTEICEQKLNFWRRLLDFQEILGLSNPFCTIYPRVVKKPGLYIVFSRALWSLWCISIFGVIWLNVASLLMKRAFSSLCSAYYEYRFFVVSVSSVISIRVRRLAFIGTELSICYKYKLQYWGWTEANWNRKQ